MILVSDLRIPSARFFLQLPAPGRGGDDDLSAYSRATIRLSIRIGLRDPESREKRSLDQ